MAAAAGSDALDKLLEDGAQMNPGPFWISPSAGAAGVVPATSSTLVFMWGGVPDASSGWSTPDSTACKRHMDEGLFADVPDLPEDCLGDMAYVPDGLVSMPVDLFGDDDQQLRSDTSPADTDNATLESETSDTWAAETLQHEVAPPTGPSTTAPAQRETPKRRAAAVPAARAVIPVPQPLPSQSVDGQGNEACPPVSVVKRVAEDGTIVETCVILGVHEVFRGRNCWQCPYCPKEFKNRYDLVPHIRTHTGERPYVCPQEGCGKRFAHCSNLHAHARSHQSKRRRCGAATSVVMTASQAGDQDTTYTCSEAGCTAAFASVSALARHRKLHAAPSAPVSI